MLCSRGIINFNLSIDKSLLNDSDKKLFANIRDLSLEITHEKFKSSGILRTLASSCVGAAQSLSYGNGQFGCVDSSSTTNDLFDPSFGFRLMNGKLGLAGQSGGTLIPGGSTGGGSGGGTTGGSSSSTSSGGPNECPPSYISEMGEDGNLICKPVSLFVCGAEKKVFTYSGAVQSYTILKSSNVTHVRIKAWGAAGGAGWASYPTYYMGAAGGYAEGIYPINADTQFAIVVGQGGLRGSTARTFGGGGAGTPGWGGSGGGLSGVFLNSFTHANSLLIAGAGAGSSGGGTVTRGFGGGLEGSATTHDGYNGQHPMPGTQSAGGVAYAPLSASLAGSPGAALSGGNASPTYCTDGGGGGGGSGYYGGSGGVGDWCTFPSAGDTDGGGGSSYLHSSLVASTTLMASIPAATSTESNPPKTYDLDYSTGVSVGTGAGNGAGGNGLVVIEGICGGSSNAPIALDDQSTIGASSTVSKNVLANDFDIDGDINPSSLVLVSTGPASKGSCSVTGTSLSFQSSSTFNDSSFCEYKICDQASNCAQAKWNIRYGIPPAPVNGVCGSAHGTSPASIPTSNLCTTGTPSAVSGASPTWTWSCLGANGGNTSSCNTVVPCALSCDRLCNGMQMVRFAFSNPSPGNYSMIAGTTTYHWGCNWGNDPTTMTTRMNNACVSGKASIGYNGMWGGFYVGTCIP
ncbi:MAG: glycine-rich protein [Bdellovibrionota bacterium]